MAKTTAFRRERQAIARPTRGNTANTELSLKRVRQRMTVNMNNCSVKEPASRHVSRSEFRGSSSMKLKLRNARAEASKTQNFVDPIGKWPLKNEGASATKTVRTDATLSPGKKDRDGLGIPLFYRRF